MQRARSHAPEMQPTPLQVIGVSQLNVDNPYTPAPQSESWAQGRPSHHSLLTSPTCFPTPHHTDSPLVHSPTAAHPTQKPFKCPHCTRGYADISTLRWHMTKVHHLRMRTVQFDRARHAVQGMPTCSLCHAKFTPRGEIGNTPRHTGSTLPASLEELADFL